MYKQILNRIYQNTLQEAKKAKEEYENLKDYQITSRTYLQGRITAYTDVLNFIKLLADVGTPDGAEQKENT